MRSKEPLRMRLTRILEKHHGKAWGTDESAEVHMTRGRFLDIVAELIDKDTEILAEQRDVQTRHERIREGAGRAVLVMAEAGLLSRKGEMLVKHWKNDVASGLGFPPLEVGVHKIVPPGA